MIDEKNNFKENINYIIKTPKKSVIPRSEKQKNYVKALRESDVIISIWTSWNRKNFFSCGSSINNAFR